MIDLKGRIALVTGSTRGIGRAIASTLAQAGAKVACNGRNEALLQSLVEEIGGSGGEALALPCDVSDEGEAKRMVDRCISELGGIDILVNNAGITRDNLFVRMKSEEWEEVIATNLTGPYNVMRAAVRRMMRQREGAIINISSVTGRTGNPGQANYSAAKGGLNGLSATLARELAPRNIRVNVVAPGLIQTEMLGGVPESARETLLSRVPLGRLGEPSDIADMVAFLASNRAKYITGQIFVVDGGLSMG